MVDRKVARRNIKETNQKGKKKCVGEQKQLWILDLHRLGLSVLYPSYRHEFIVRVAVAFFIVVVAL